MHNFGLLSLSSLSSDRKKNCGKSWIAIRPDLSLIILSVAAEYKLGGGRGQSLLSAMFHSGGAGGVKRYNGGHFPPIRQDGRFNYVLQPTGCPLQDPSQAIKRLS